MTRLEHEVHPYVEMPNPDAPFPTCICGLGQTHHLHAGISSAICTYTCCYRVRHPEEFPPARKPEEPT